MKEKVRNVIQFQRRDAARSRSAGGGGGMSSGGDGSDFDARLTRLETSFEHVSTALTDIRSDIRLLLGGGLGVGVLLMGTILSSHQMLAAKDDAIIEMMQTKDDAIIEMIQSTRDTLAAKDDAIIERLSRVETDVAILVAENEDRGAKRSDTPRARRDGAESPATRETLH